VAVAGAAGLDTMKFHATVIFEFNAHDVGEAGERLNELLAHAAERQLETRSLELATPPGNVGDATVDLTRLERRQHQPLRLRHEAAAGP
jgi:hypothetical protein